MSDWGIKLDEDVRRVARQQLREDENTREQTLEQMREWITKCPDIQNCRLDANFLLRFLRVKKYSVPMAQQTLLKYLSLRQSLPHLCSSLDTCEPSVRELISSGYIFALPERDAQGRRVIFTVAGKLDPYKFTCNDMAKAHILTYEALLEDEVNQVQGFVHVSDLQHLSPAHVTLWSPSEFSTVVKWGEQSLPMRHRELHFLNIPATVRTVYNVCRGLFSEKMRNRFQIHLNLNELHGKVGSKILPKEYGGVVPMQEMIDQWQGELRGKRERILSLDKIRLTRIIKPQSKRKNTNDLRNSINSLPGSFRRLEVD